jgi:superfamily II DNA helicase RecQ
MDLKDMPYLIGQFTGENSVPDQYSIIEACLKRILQKISPGIDRSPHPEQVRTIRRLIYGKGDTLLIARTGFGKSLILHSFSVLTGKITIQLTPLNKLGEKQLRDISKLNHNRPCILNAESKRQKHDIIDQIRRGVYTHIVLGPEQAMSKVFQNALLQSEFQSRIGLVAIDKYYLIKQWEIFRVEFTILGQLRIILRSDILWFGCSNTLRKETENYILYHAGFRPLGCHQWQIKVIRTSVNRSDLFIYIRPIPRRKLNSFNILYFLLDVSTESGDSTESGEVIILTPERIPKTIVFIDSIAQVQAAADSLRAMLYLKTVTSSAAERYSSIPGDVYSVYNVISTFTARVSKYD